MAGKPRTPAVRRDCACPVARHKHGTDLAYTHCHCRCDECRAAHAARQRNRGRAIAYGRHQPRVAAIGYTRRVRALGTLGWSGNQIASSAGLSSHEVRRIRDGRCMLVHARTAMAIARVYDQLWDKRPPADTPIQRRGIAQVTNLAKAGRWKPPLFWDDDTIDHAAAEQPHGTHAAFVRHKSYRQKPCQACVHAEAAYQAARRGSQIAA